MTHLTLFSAVTALFLSTAGEAQAHGLHPDNGHEPERVHVRPDVQSLPVVVENDAGRAITVYADGRQLVVIPAGARLKVKVSSEVRWLEARVGSRRVSRLRMGEERTFWEVERPTETSVMVSNPLPIPVEITLDGVTRTVAAEGSLFFGDVPVGSRTIVARRVTGQVLSRDKVKLSAFEDTRWQIEPPSTGLVQVLNRWSSSLQVKVNGKVVAVLEPGETRTFEFRAGSAEVTLTRVGRRGRMGPEVVDTHIRVDRYETERLVTGPVGRSQHAQGPRHGVR